MWNDRGFLLARDVRQLKPGTIEIAEGSTGDLQKAYKAVLTSLSQCKPALERVGDICENLHLSL